ncbi:hypothetical protein CPJCM30710_14990 [Clostridium polyendosporum]|uniref:Uncharacterized protein n=1 Tax=Clostridium polyendosporum TaxID=69208 RepID=A0A919VLQ7_9CLOT|nr:hypothetical protein [Clostridium polyendosporum]GIM28833.1 hypothetical protein CPJCM30710_14990 [Clostridium polyendosporum]
MLHQVIRTLIWNDVEKYIEDIFNIPCDQFGLLWVKKSWNGLIKQGLADYRNELERNLVLFRLLTLATMYGEFYELVTGETPSPSHDAWIESLDISPIRIGQIIGRHSYNANHYSSEDLLKISISRIINIYRKPIFNALVTEFGSDRKLFIGMWIAIKNTDSIFDTFDHYSDLEIQCDLLCPIDNDTDSDEDDDINLDSYLEKYEQEIKEESFILILDVKDSMLRAFDWITRGMNSRNIGL